jgi:hypothetical protein
MVSRPDIREAQTANTTRMLNKDLHIQRWSAGPHIRAAKPPYNKDGQQRPPYIKWRQRPAISGGQRPHTIRIVSRDLLTGSRGRPQTELNPLSDKIKKPAPAKDFRRNRRTTLKKLKKMLNQTMEIEKDINLKM